MNFDHSSFKMTGMLISDKVTKAGMFNYKHPWIIAAPNSLKFGIGTARLVPKTTKLEETISLILII